MPQILNRTTSCLLELNIYQPLIVWPNACWWKHNCLLRWPHLFVGFFMQEVLHLFTVWRSWGRLLRAWWPHCLHVRLTLTSTSLSLHRPHIFIIKILQTCNKKNKVSRICSFLETPETSLNLLIQNKNKSISFLPLLTFTGSVQRRLGLFFFLLNWSISAALILS